MSERFVGEADDLIRVPEGKKDPGRMPLPEPGQTADPKAWYGDTDS